ncbi:hypothetical protein QQF64_020294 [Cirrhinus molitorella]|uniref:SPRY-associated domain-containing protein n=1 Tax=Cirrhinus molitorella TaxID=172907 RepID=A0ABR3L8Q4_9TELE
MEQLKKLGILEDIPVKPDLVAVLKCVQKFAVDVTLDPDTVHPYLILSDDGKQVFEHNISESVHLSELTAVHQCQELLRAGDSRNNSHH